MAALTPWLQDADVTLYHGDVLATLRELPAESVDCVVTSPPYWGLRDYGQEGQLGLEPTPEQYVEKMVEVFREIRRVLAAHGTVWLNLGDSYSSDPKKGGSGTPNGRNGRGEDYARGKRIDRGEGRWGGGNAHAPALKPKDLVGIPWRVAFALQADGWYLRSDIIWSKPNPMPESVTDRPTKAHEYVFLLSKQPRYFFDQEAVREAFEAKPQQRLTPLKDQPLAAARRAAGVEQGNPQGGTHTNPWHRQAETLAGDCGCHDAGCGRSFHADDCGCACHNGEPRGADGRRQTRVVAGDFSEQHRDGERWPNGGRNIRSVWEIATQPYPEAHFATFPEELARRCIAAGTPEAVCRVCRKARERVVDVSYTPHGEAAKHNAEPNAERGSHGKIGDGMDGTHGGPQSMAHGRASKNVQTLGFTDCGHGDYRPGIVLDPFIGSGTVAYVARKLGRRAVGIDLSAEYLELAARRLQQQSLFAQESV